LGELFLRVLVQVLYRLESLFMFRNSWANFENQFGRWESNIGILGQKWGFPESWEGDLCHTSPREREPSQRRVMPIITRHGE